MCGGDDAIVGLGSLKLGALDANVWGGYAVTWI